MLAQQHHRLRGRRGISPFGQRQRSPTLMEEPALRHETVFINAGGCDLRVEISPSAAAQAVGALVCSLIARARSAAFAFSGHVAGLAKVVPVLIGVMMRVAIFAHTKLVVPLYVNGARKRRSLDARLAVAGIPVTEWRVAEA